MIMEKSLLVLKTDLERIGRNESRTDKRLSPAEWNRLDHLVQKLTLVLDIRMESMRAIFKVLEVSSLAY